MFGEANFIDKGYNMIMNHDQILAQKCQHYVGEIAEMLTDLQWSLATAESCTGGWLSKVCTDISGSSVWFYGGILCYSIHSKREFLHVKQQTLDQYGAVSEQVTDMMTNGLLLRTPARIGVAISGIAGPGGGTEHKPVGTVCFSWQTVCGVHHSRRMHFDGDRAAVRMQSVYYALSGVHQILSERSRQE